MNADLLYQRSARRLHASFDDKEFRLAFATAIALLEATCEEERAKDPVALRHAVTEHILKCLGIDSPLVELCREQIAKTSAGTVVSLSSWRH